jgi:2,3-bisphosphoglycerate-independent phosphoglycerate mutase
MDEARPFVILIVLDGFGCRSEREWNAIAQAETPNLDRLFASNRWTTLEASGLHVGLPDGQMGNSEVGHLNMGAGRIVPQDTVRISAAVESGEMARNAVLSRTVKALRENGGSLHFVGLLSDGGVHSLQQHLHGLIDAAIANGMTPNQDGSPSIFVHAILDGRDTPPMSARKYVRALLDHLEGKPQAHMSTIIGRYYTMDRDRRWERTQRGYDLMTLGIAAETKTPFAYIDRFYEEGITDEFMEPMAMLLADGSHRGKIRDGDAVLFFNFRADRMRQIVSAFRDEDFQGFERSVHPQVSLVTMTSYHEEFDIPVMFLPIEVRNHLGQVLSAAGLRQLRIAETEKYAHVTFFFNGGSDEASPGEERILIPSPKVATYDQKPEMSLVELAARVASEIDSGKYDVVILNIANPDMVGHTGVMEAAVKAVEATDAAIGTILDAVDRRKGVALITADHGNCELMFDPQTGQPHTAHTTNPVPLILHDSRGEGPKLLKGGSLENIAPTILQILGIEKPGEMTAESLLRTP